MGTLNTYFLEAQQTNNFRLNRDWGLYTRFAEAKVTTAASTFEIPVPPIGVDFKVDLYNIAITATTNILLQCASTSGWYTAAAEYRDVFWRGNSSTATQSFHNDNGTSRTGWEIFTGLGNNSFSKGCGELHFIRSQPSYDLQMYWQTTGFLSTSSFRYSDGMGIMPAILHGNRIRLIVSTGNIDEGYAVVWVRNSGAFRAREESLHPTEIPGYMEP